MFLCLVLPKHSWKSSTAGVRRHSESLTVQREPDGTAGVRPHSGSSAVQWASGGTAGSRRYSGRPATHRETNGTAGARRYSRSPPVQREPDGTAGARQYSTRIDLEQQRQPLHSSHVYPNWYRESGYVCIRGVTVSGAHFQRCTVCDHNSSFSQSTHTSQGGCSGRATE